MLFQAGAIACAKVPGQEEVQEHQAKTSAAETQRGPGGGGAE